MTYSEQATPVANGPLIPAFLVADLPLEPVDAAAELGVSFAAFGPARGGAWQADLDLPRGSSWRLLPDHRAALWLARDAATAVPPIARSWRPLKLDMFTAMHRLAAIEGVWLTEARILREGMSWTAPLVGSAALRLVGQTGDVVAVSGTWSDQRSRAVAGELHHDGRMWAESHVQAERWLLVAAGISGEAGAYPLSTDRGA